MLLYKGVKTKGKLGSDWTWVGPQKPHGEMEVLFKANVFNSSNKLSLILYVILPLGIGKHK